jgi:hypothetical protein
LGQSQGCPFFSPPSFSKEIPMAPCNYIPLEIDRSELPSLYLDELFDLDVLYMEEGIFINSPID